MVEAASGGHRIMQRRLENTTITGVSRTPCTRLPIRIT